MPLGAFVCGMWLSNDPIEGLLVRDDINLWLEQNNVSARDSQNYFAPQDEFGGLTKGVALWIIDGEPQSVGGAFVTGGQLLNMIGALPGVRRLNDGAEVVAGGLTAAQRASIETWLADREVMVSIANATTMVEQARRIAIALNPAYQRLPAWFDPPAPRAP